MERMFALKISTKNTDELKVSSLKMSDLDSDPSWLSSVQ